VFLDVNFEDPLAQLPDPLFGVAELDDVTDIEIRTDPGTIKFVDVPCELDRAEQELVPDLFDGNLDPVLLRIGDELSDICLRATIGFAVANLSVDHRGDDQDRSSTVGATIIEFLADRVNSPLHDLGIGIRERILPVTRAADAVDHQTRLIPRA